MNARRTPRIFGVSNVTIAMTNSRIMRSLSNNGQRGNNDISSVKYSNCTVAMWPGGAQADDDQRKPQRRGEVAHDADAHVRAVRPGEPLAPERPRDAGCCPAPSAGRARRRRAATAGCLPSCRRASAACAPPSPRGAATRLRRSRATGSRRRTASCRAASANRRRRRTRARGRSRCGPNSCRRCPASSRCRARRSGPYTRPANCCSRANNVLPPASRGTVCSRPRFGSAAISRTSVTSVSGARMLSASSTIMKS